jgi:aldose 1-epimerase
VCASLRHAGEEVLGQRRGLTAYVERGSTMGVPLLHPWANRLGALEYSAAGGTGRLDPDAPSVRLEEHGLPVHGLLAASPLWELDELEDRAISAELDLGAHPELLAAFPFPHLLRMEVALDGDALTWTTSVTPTGESDVPIAFGYHPYFRLPGVPRAAWELEVPVVAHVETDDRKLPTGELRDVAPLAGPLGERTRDDGYTVDAPARSTLRGGGREIALEVDGGYPFTQVFAPPGEELVAIEPMTAPADALRTGWALRAVSPGQRFAAAFTVRVGWA